MQICSAYGLDAEEVVDEWHAYAAALNLSDATPTSELLVTMERKVFVNRKQAKASVTPAKAKVYADELYPFARF